MASKELVTKVWIEPGCIVCDACETTCPEVFEVTDDTCIIRPPALSADFTRPLTDSIKDAAAECPVDVIKYEVAMGEAPDAAPSAAPAAPAPAAEVKPAPAAKSHDAPAPAPAKAPAPAAAGKAAEPAPKTSVAGEPDPAIAALLRAATSRGGHAGILRKGDTVPDSVQSMRNKDASQLPPDARQAKVLEEARKQRKDPDAQRRAMVGGAALAVGWMAFGGATGIAAGPAFARFLMPNVLEEPDPRVRVGKLSKYIEMAPGDVNEDYKPQGIWMVREEGLFVALNIICTHLGCIPNWLPNDRKYKCPCHGSGYYYNGINFEGPTPRPLERFKVSVIDGIVVVDKSKKFQYELGQWVNPDSFVPV